MSRSHRNRTQFSRPDARSTANLPKAPWAHRRVRESELRLAAPSIRPVLQATATYQHDGRLRTAAVRPTVSESIYIGRGNISSDSGWRVLPDIAAARASKKLSRQHPPSASSPGAPPPTARGREIPACSAPHSGWKKGFPIENPFWKQNIPGLPRRKKKLKENERQSPETAFKAEVPASVTCEVEALPACGLRILAHGTLSIPKRDQNDGRQRDAPRTGRPTRMSNHARMRLISICELQRLDLRQISAGAQTYADTLAIKRSKAGSRGEAAAAGSMRMAGGSTAAALEGHGAETLAAQALAAKDYAGAAEVYNPRTELSAEWFTHAERRYPLEGRGPSRMTMNLSSGMRETKDYAGAAAVLDTALIELQRTSGGAASHSTTTAEALLAQAQHELREQLHGSPHAGKP